MPTSTIEPPQTPHPSPLQPQPRTPQVQQPTVYVYERPEWEYRTLSKSAAEGPPTDEMLNTLGADGWELVGIANVADGIQLFFKRAKR